jgi:hypothetical protein
MIVTIVLCGWCKSVKPLEVHGAENLPPGLHTAHMQLSHGVCIPCDTKIRLEAGILPEGGETQGVTSANDNLNRGRG